MVARSVRNIDDLPSRIACALYPRRGTTPRRRVDRIPLRRPAAETDILFLANAGPAAPGGFPPLAYLLLGLSVGFVAGLLAGRQLARPAARERAKPTETPKPSGAPLRLLALLQ